MDGWMAKDRKRCDWNGLFYLPSSLTRIEASHSFVVCRPSQTPGLLLAGSMYIITSYLNQETSVVF